MTKQSGGKKFVFRETDELRSRLNPRHEAVGHAEADQLKALQGYDADLLRAPDAARRGMRSEIARGMAGAMGQTGGNISGGSTAFLAQQGLTGGLAEAQFEAETMPALSLARAEGAQARAELAMSQEEREGQKKAQYINQISAIQQGNSGFFTDDQAASAQAVMDLAASEPDPVLREWLFQKASQIRSTPSNMFTKMGF
ncbi:MAG: hypothetical protein QF615_02185 [Planctomycetota bacterium]|nr:hypothetical protein [Planctomycetota bacterium]